MATKSSSSQSPATPKKGERPSAQPKVSSSETATKSARGRPPKQTIEKSAYAHVVLPERIMQSLHLAYPEEASVADALTSAKRTQDNSIQEEILRTELGVKLREIMEVPAAYAYYWQLVFSASFYLLRDKAIQDKPSDLASDSTRSFSVRQIAQAAGLEYHNLKNLFMGRGTLRHLHEYQLFLFAQGIEFSQLQFNVQLIDKAYFYLICLRQPDVSDDVVAQLFF